MCYFINPWISCQTCVADNGNKRVHPRVMIFTSPDTHVKNQVLSANIFIYLNHVSASAENIYLCHFIFLLNVMAYNLWHNRRISWVENGMRIQVNLEMELLLRIKNAKSKSDVRNYFFYPSLHDNHRIFKYSACMSNMC